MSGLSLEVEEIDLSGIERRFSRDALSKAVGRLTLQVASDSNKYCKVDTGDTQRSMGTNVSASEGSVQWTTPYASEAYYDPRVRTEKNPNAHSQWFEHARSVHGDDWARVVREALGG